MSDQIESTRRPFLKCLSDTIRPLADPARILAETCRLLGTHLRVNRVAYGEIDGDDCVIVGEYVDGLPPQPARFRWGIHGASRTAEILKGGTLAVNDTSAEAHTAEERAALQAAGIGAYICPLLIKDGQFIGSFGIHSCAPRVWTADEIALVEEVADRTWATLEHRRAEAELRANHARLAFLLRLNDALRPLSDPSTVQETAARLLCEHLGVARVGYAEVRERDYTIRHEHTQGVAPLAGSPPQISVGPTLRAALSSGETVVVADVATDSRLTDDDRATLESREIAAFVGIGLSKHQRMVAVFGANHHSPREWTAAEIDVVRDVAERTWEAVERTRAEVERRHAEEALLARREEEHDRELRMLLETATQGIVLVDARGTIVTANRAIEAMFGWGEGELIGVRIERLLAADVRDLHLQHRNEYFAAPRARLMGGGRHLMAERKDGSTFPVEVSLNHIATAGGGRAIAFVTDITERHRAASALLEHTAELEYRTLQLSRMASDLTLAEHNAREQIARTLHDGLQQLLLIAVLNIEQQLEREREGGAGPSELLADAKHHLDEAIEAARSLHLELFPPVLQRSGLPAALTWLAKWTRDKYRLHVDIDADPRADSPRKDVRTLLFESTRELLLNAFKHARADRVAMELSLSAGDRLCIVVTDNGVGFDPASLDDRSKAGHVGWGLFSIRERLTLLGGRLDIDSARGGGTRVYLVAPRGADQSTAAAANVASLPPIAAAPAAGDGRALPDALRILIVDDHTALRDALRVVLHERPQLSVVGDAANGVEAIAHAYALHPDVILMDVAMPHMDGVEATARIHSELPDIQILGLSMHARVDTVHPIERAGAARFFVKGRDTQRLIDHLLAVHATRRTGANAT